MIYMNNAATSFPKPECVGKAMAETILREPGDGYRGGSDTVCIFDSVRRELTPILGVSEPRQIALGPNATWGLNLGIFGFPLLPGDCVVSTKAEHNSVLRPLHQLSQRGIRVVLLDTDPTGRIDPDLWAQAMETCRPRLAVFTHASNVTGAVNDAAALTSAAKAFGACVMIDAAQTLGFSSLQAEAWGADMVAFTGHKYLLGPQGTGGLWIRPGLDLQPYLVGGTGIQSDLDAMPEAMPLHLEAGTGNEPSFSGLLAALQWQKEHPADRQAILRKAHNLAEGLRLLGAQVIEPNGERTPVISFQLPGISTEETGYLLRESCQIVCRTGLHCAPRIFSCLGMKQSVRLSLSRFNTDAEIEEVLQAVEAILS